jgi:hypothetical protein
MDGTINEQTILNALHQLPRDRWDTVLTFIESLQPVEASGSEVSASPLPLTAADLLNSDLVGVWSDRSDIGKSRDFARRLREQTQSRSGS